MARPDGNTISGLKSLINKIGAREDPILKYFAEVERSIEEQLHARQYIALTRNNDLDLFMERTMPMNALEWVLK